MEEILIYKVQEKRVLYDSTSTIYKDHRARNLAWDEIATELGLTTLECRDMWFKLRNAYNSARKRRLRNLKRNVPTMGKWKFEDQMSFLAPYMGTASVKLGNSTKNYKVSGNPKNDINYTIDETMILDDESDDDDYDDVDDEIDDEVVTDDNNDCGNPVSYIVRENNNEPMISSLPTNEDSSNAVSDPLADSSDPLISSQEFVVNNTASSSSSSEKIMMKKPQSKDNTDSGVLTHDANKRSLLKNKDSSNPEVRTSKCRKSCKCCHINGETNDNNVLTLIIKNPSKNGIENEDDLLEEEYYLTLARMAKKLKPPDRIKLRDKISRVVMDALINTLPENSRSAS